MRQLAFNTLSRRRPRLKKLFWRRWYQFLASRYRDPEWTFMNYGYEPLDGHAAGPTLKAIDEPDRYFIQLYHHVVKGADIAGRTVLEIGSGRGGGASYLKRYLSPRRMIGLDFSTSAVGFATASHAHAGPDLCFLPGDAESLPFADGTFDIVINVESSHCYGSMETFLAQVRRVLKTDGRFLFADFRRSEEMPALQRHIEKADMTVVALSEITPNVLRSLELDDARKSALIRKVVPSWLTGIFRQFAGMVGSKMHRNFSNGATVYVHYVLRKQAP